MSDENEKKSYVVRDRRKLNSPEADEPPAKSPPKEDRPAARAATPAASAATPTPGPTPPPAAKAEPRLSSGEHMVDFASFVLSIATNAVMNLGGESADGRVPSGRINLNVAAQHIDILSMLTEKTRGNLNAEEHELLTSLLYDLRMHYVAVTQEIAKQASGQPRR